MGQEEHFLKLFKAAEMAGWYKPPTRCSFAGFGVVQGCDGKKFKTRSGDVVRLVDLLDEAVVRAKEELIKRAAETGGDSACDGEEIDRRAEVLGYSAVKYFDLKQNRTTDYQFSYDRMEHCGVSAVRVCSHLRDL
ncbi:arginyl-tRNA synthetase, putative [Eimeria maxima]|uniref:Arginyl-tRNA synthetase, putative n=1 Tax=Eimeria maxima TaxID=5804 RepID=U6M3B7_EIMMA|nr:arginyl-tRNA synthetase, putative [Eimeria maxima]CDJ56939.1 arginyl-tRNA synthetase, putative [Eimeria maxima]